MSGLGNRGDKAQNKLDLTGRESWWLGTLKDTPIPGTYHVRDFIEEATLNPVRKTYAFKDVGRKPQTLGVRKGDLLLPGAYHYNDFIREIQVRPATYCFKNCPRSDLLTPGFKDKDVNVSPCEYDVTAKPVEKMPCKHFMFRSVVQRVNFPPKEGPAPCDYNPQCRPGTSCVTSCFKSTVPRLHRVSSSTPGPGSYEPSWKLRRYCDVEPRTGSSFSLLFRDIP